MGAGVGSGSMTAAAVGAIAAQHPEMSDQIATFAAAANLIATTVGTYLTLFISLPWPCVPINGWSRFWAASASRPWWSRP
jgi:hypothetical protein